MESNPQNCILDLAYKTQNKSTINSRANPRLLQVSRNVASMWNQSNTLFQLKYYEIIEIIWTLSDFEQV